MGRGSRRLRLLQQLLLLRDALDTSLRDICVGHLDLSLEQQETDNYYSVNKISTLSPSNSFFLARKLEH